MEEKKIDNGPAYITAYMRQTKTGEWVTDIRKNNQLIRTVPTPPSQIRPARESLLWKPDPKSKKSFEDDFDFIDQPLIKDTYKRKRA